MKYSKEELKAIKELENFMNKNEPYVFYSKQKGDTAEVNPYIRYYEAYKTILNLISKQQKEIENSVSKDKIREEINRIDYDIKNTKQILDEGNRFTTYVNCYRKMRLKAFITKSKEIKLRLEKLLEE